MILQYFKKKENKEQIIAKKQYKYVIYESNIFLNDNNFFITKDYKTSFEIISIFLIMFIRINLLQNDRKKYLTFTNNMFILFICNYLLFIFFFFKVM